MSDHSDYVSLGDVVTERSERINDPSSSDVSRFIGLEHFDSGSLSIRRFGSTDDLESAMKLCKAGDTLVARRNVYLKRAALTEIDAICSGDAIVLHETSDLVPGFLPIILNSSYFWDYANENADGSMSKRLSVKHLKDYRFILPSKEQQQTITQLVWKLENLLIQLNSTLNRLDLLVKSRFIEMFGVLKDNPNMWPIESFNEFAEIDTNMIKDFDEYADYPHIGVDSIQSQTGELIGFRTVKEDAVVSGKYLFGPQHIIYSKIRPNLNKVALPDFEGLCSADAYPILPKSNCNRVYLAYVLRSEYYLSYILKLSGRSNIPKVNKVQIQGFKMPLPPIELQNQFADFVRQVDKSKVVLLKHIEDTKSLQQSIINSCFEANEDV